VVERADAMMIKARNAASSITSLPAPPKGV
jgi:hypothetical protein